MSSLLRSCQFLKNICSIPRNVNLTSNVMRNLTLMSSYCNKVETFNESNKFRSQNLVEEGLKKLDNGAKRIGRISVNELNSVLDGLNQTRSATSTQALMIIRCCGNLLPEETPQKRTEIVKSIWESLEKLGTQLDVSHYNALLRVYLENEHKFSPTEFLADMESKGVNPNRVTYQRLITRYCQEGNISGATKILEFMRDKSFPITEGVFNALIHGHSQANDLKSAEGILQMMKQAGIEPSSETYTTLLCSYAKHGEFELLKNTLNSCEASLINTDLLEIVYALAIHRHHQHLDEVISKIRPGVGYSADAANYIFRLVNKEEIDTAFKIVLTLARTSNISGEQLPTGGFLIKHMVKTQQPVDRVLEICKKLAEENLHSNPFKLAAQTAVEHAPLDYLVDILRLYKEQGNDLRIHFFFPIFIRLASQKNETELLRVIQTIEKEFGLQTTSEAVRDYILPALENKNEVSDLFFKLRTAGVSLGNLTSAYMVHFLAQKNLKQAAKIASSFRAIYPTVFVRKHLIGAYLKSRDLQSFVTVVNAVCQSIERNSEEKSNKDVEFSGNVLIDIFIATKRQDISIGHLQQVLDAFVEASIPISRGASEYIQNGLQANMTPEIAATLSKLTSEELQFQPMSYAPGQMGKFVQTPESLQNMIEKLENQGEKTSGLKRGMFALYIKNKDVDNALAYIKKLESEPDFEVQPGIYAQIADLLAEKEMFDECEHYVNEMKAKFPEVKLDNVKVMKIAHALFVNNKETEMINFLKYHAKTIEENSDLSASVNGQAWRLLNTYAEKTNPIKTKQLFELLRTSNYIQPNNFLLGAVIKAHVLKEDYSGAVEMFEESVKQYRATPWKRELLRHFIDKEDAVSLQRITDLSTSVHGEINSLYDLMFSFLDCGRLRQARKILETPGMTLRPERLSYILEHYLSQGSVDKIENLLKVTHDISTFDRNAIYLVLVDHFAKENDVEKALGLWTQMQEVDETPSDEFLLKLGKILKKNGREVPFSVPKDLKETKTADKISNDTAFVDARMRRSLMADNVNEALRLYHDSKDKLSIVSKLKLVAALQKTQRINVVNEILEKITRADLDTLINVVFLKEVLLNLSSEQIKLLEPKLSEDLKRKTYFNAIFLKVKAKENKLKEYIESIQVSLAKSTDPATDLELVKKLSMGGIVGSLELQPSAVPAMLEVAEKFFEKKYFNPINAVFNYFYIKGQFDEATKVFEKFLTKTGRPVKYNVILNEISRSNDISQANLLIDLVKKSNDVRSLSNIYNYLINILIRNEQFTQALTMLETSISENATQFISKNTVNKLQLLGTQVGQTIPLSVISKLTFSNESNSVSSSDSSSDSESEKVKK